jgi:Ca-activated chloride channel family protein
MPAPGAGQFTSGVAFVEVYATVTDVRNEPITDLSVDDFTVEENGEPQAIGAFAAGEFPLAVAVAVDHSFSIPGNLLRAAVTAARTFIEALKPGDRVMTIGIGSEIEVLAPLSDDRVAAAASLSRITSWGTTPLYDATLAAIGSIQPASGRRALILISDGSDRYSRTTDRELIGEARRRDVMVYPVATGRARPAVFVELAALTGGRSFHIEDPRELPARLATIARELRFQYLLGYAPVRDAGDRPGWRSIRVTVKRPGARVRARDGYLTD